MKANHTLSLLGFLLSVLLGSLLVGRAAAVSDFSKTCDEITIADDGSWVEAKCNTPPMGPPWICSKLDLNLCLGNQAGRLVAQDRYVNYSPPLAFVVGEPFPSPSLEAFPEMDTAAGAKTDLHPALLQWRVHKAVQGMRRSRIARHRLPMLVGPTPSRWRLGLLLFGVQSG